MMKTARLTMACLLAGLIATSSALAHEGESHEPPPPAARATQPRFVASSESFELVGVVEGAQLTLYLDRADTNAPVDAAQIELDVGGEKLNAAPKGEGRYAVPLPKAALAAARAVPIIATVTAGDESDLLNAELPAPPHEHPPTRAPRAWLWSLAALLAALLALTVFIKRRGGAR